MDDKVHFMLQKLLHCLEYVRHIIMRVRYDSYLCHVTTSMDWPGFEPGASPLPAARYITQTHQVYLVGLSVF